MNWTEFEEKWGKTAFKLAARLVANAKQNEFIEDLLSLPTLFDHNNKYTVLVRDTNTVAKLINRIPENFNILHTNYISAVENITADDLNVQLLENYEGICIFMYEDTPEAQVTKEYITERFKQITFISIPYGFSAKSPADTDDYTFNRVLLKIIKETIKSQ